MKQRSPEPATVHVFAAIGDVVAVYLGFLAAIWIRLESGVIPLFHGADEYAYPKYYVASVIGTVLVLLVFKSVGLFERPRVGRFQNRIPAIFRATGMGLVLCVLLAYLVRNFTNAPLSAGALIIAFFTISLFVILERYSFHRLEIRLARRSTKRNRILVLGIDEVGIRLRRVLETEPILRSSVAGFLSTSDDYEIPECFPEEMIMGSLSDLDGILSGSGFEQVVLTDGSLDHDRVMNTIVICEKHLVQFAMVPDTYQILIGSATVQTLGDVPLLGVRRWPLEVSWNRFVKRLEDFVGAILLLLVTGPLIGLLAMLVKISSPGPAFFKQQRTGEAGKEFTLLKLRTMRTDAEAKTGPVWASEDDPRCTRLGAFLRKTNLDELPQFWNVLRGDMSLVGPRPERPHFVESFKDDVEHYMWRHVSKPGITGWAQVNGLRGNTSISERIKYDLYYLEHWSLALDLRILLMTLWARENAY
jgi:exopolysaccharide biosynthesis polyprenyl glycosylphosphotransferase